MLAQVLDKSVAICEVHPNKAAASAYLEHSHKLRKSLESSVAQVSLSEHDSQPVQDTPPRSSSSSASSSSANRQQEKETGGSSSPPPKKKMMRRKKKRTTEL